MRIIKNLYVELKIVSYSLLQQLDFNIEWY